MFLLLAGIGFYWSEDFISSDLWSVKVVIIILWDTTIDVFSIDFPSPHDQKVSIEEWKKT